MKELSYYRGREQTYLKHFFLERYLEAVAYRIGWGYREFVYVDGFSGPWRSQDEAFEDTSFMIAIQRLRSVRDSLARLNREPRIRCVFVESQFERCEELRRAVQDIQDFEIVVIAGEFENVQGEVMRAAGESFSLTFVDPLGWSGLALRRLAPLLRRHGEVLINFMFDYVNRFSADGRQPIARSFDDFFGGPGWDEVVRQGEESMLEFYQRRLGELCGFHFVTRTQILKPRDNRTYFYLVYGTRHLEGLKQFRKSERKFLQEQERIRADASQDARQTRTGQGELFREADAAEGALVVQARKWLDLAEHKVLELLRSKSPQLYESVLPRLLVIPMVHEIAIKGLIRVMEAKGTLVVEGRKPRARSVGPGCRLSLRS